MILDVARKKLYSFLNVDERLLFTSFLMIQFVRMFAESLDFCERKKSFQIISYLYIQSIWFIRWISFAMERTKSWELNSFFNVNWNSFACTFLYLKTTTFGLRCVKITLPFIAKTLLYVKYRERLRVLKCYFLISLIRRNTFKERLISNEYSKQIVSDI